MSPHIDAAMPNKNTLTAPLTCQSIHRIIASSRHRIKWLPHGACCSVSSHKLAVICVRVRVCVLPIFGFAGCAARWRGGISRTIFVCCQAPCILGLHCFFAKSATRIGFTNFPVVVGRSLPGHHVQFAGTRGRLRSPVTGEGIEKLISFRRKSASVMPVPNTQLPSTPPSPTPLTHHTFPT